MQYSDMATNVKVKDILEGLAFVAAIIGAPALVFQSCEMVKATRAAREATQATRDAVVVSQVQMSVAERQLDDAEAQQRAWLKVEEFSIKRATNAPMFPIPGHYEVEVRTVLKNYGSTPAKDIHLTGFCRNDSTERMDKALGVTKLPQKWRGGTRNPEPLTGGGAILPQESLTNVAVMASWENGDGFYDEQWVNYRDIFGHAWVIGTGGHYDATNDTFRLELFYNNQYQQAGTNR